MLEAKSRARDCSPWFMITFRGFGLMWLMNAISSFREEWPENPSIERNCILIGIVSSLPFTLNVASFIPL